VPEQLQQQQNSPRIMQADGLPQSADPMDSAGSPSGYQLTSNPVKPNANPFDGIQSLGSGAIDGLPLGQNLPSFNGEHRTAGDMDASKNEKQQLRRTRTTGVEKSRKMSRP
jgi:hypothetical protein